MSEQLQFDYLLAHACPLLTVEESGFILSTGPFVIDSLLDQGLLRAIDIRRKKKTNPTEEKTETDEEKRLRRVLRIWRWSVLHRACRPEEPLGSVPLEKSLPHERPVWRAGEAANFLRCSDDHIWNLFDDGDLTGPNANAGRPGLGKSRRPERASILTFLKKREIV